MSRSKGQCVVVTGGAGDIGEATVRGIVDEGGQVAIADLQGERSQALVPELADTIAFCANDVSREEDIASAIALAQQRFGPLTGMVNNAG